ncbi:hypothetical protein [Deinococcus sp. QL22]|uniref:hypothetical protein n=1 Tax=Deinococcus sp. QL22 TaxID=2939437 RepID=UPI002017DF0E|nr:hypothetical protein [Deinococcus sp. QL22]UQN08437.1 hypothetical protein M1R55_17100 [Deinococcus sp. QL22]
MSLFRAFEVMLCCPVCLIKLRKKYHLLPVHEVAQEVPVGSYRADVAILGENAEVKVAFEAYYAHQVPEDKALGLTVLWFEVQVNLAALLKQAGVPLLTAVNTNLFARQPCSRCGNAAASKAQAQANVLAAKQQRLEEQAAKAAALQAAQKQEREARSAQRQKREQAEMRIYRVALPAHAQEQAVLSAFLTEHLPDIDTRLSHYTTIVAVCPGCSLQTVFFDSQHMVPTWTALVRRDTAFQPWQSVCIHCGWHGRAPSGVAFTRSAAGAVAQTETFSQMPHRAPALSAQPEGRFWWQED